MNAGRETNPDIYESLREQLCLEESLRITTGDYRKAVSALLDLAFADSGGSRFAAQVLLSLYDGDRWQVDLAGVCCALDGGCFRNVLIAMRGRAMLMEEPHTVVANGDRLFEQLADRWKLLAKPASESHS